MAILRIRRKCFRKVIFFALGVVVLLTIRIYSKIEMQNDLTGSKTHNRRGPFKKVEETMRKSIDYMNVTIPEPGNLTAEEIATIASQINKINEDQEIFNLDKFGPVNSETFVMVVQVHIRCEYVGFLIESLSFVDGIDNALIIFSHDVYSPEMNEAIQRIDFVRTMQIFLPITNQLYPEKFQLKTIPKGGPKKVVSETLAKHHYWWKANFVFGKIRVLKNHDRVITFLEEDDYAIPDFIWMMKKLEFLMRENQCHGCDVLIGGHVFYGLDILDSWKDRTTLDIAIVTSHGINRALAFNRTMWHKFRECSRMFCEIYNDTNWDYSLLHVSAYCLKSRFTVLTPEAPRMIHVGVCGWHFLAKSCDPVPIIDAIKTQVNKFKSQLFPSNIGLRIDKSLFIEMRKRPRGWTNPDDHELCLSFSQM